MKKRQTITGSLDSLTAAVPQLRELQERYAAEAHGLEVNVRLAWLEANMEEELVDAFAEPTAIELTGLSPQMFAAAVADDFLRKWTETGAPTLIEDLLGPSVTQIETADGTPALVVFIHAMTDLEVLFQEIRDKYAATFPPLGIRPRTIEDVAFVQKHLRASMKMTDIAWEFIYEAYPEARALDRHARIEDYGDEYKKAYNRVRWLKSHGMDAVKKLSPEHSQDSS